MVGIWQQSSKFLPTLRSLSFPVSLFPLTGCEFVSYRVACGEATGRAGIGLGSLGLLKLSGYYHLPVALSETLWLAERMLSRILQPSSSRPAFSQTLQLQGQGSSFPGPSGLLSPSNTCSSEISAHTGVQCSPHIPVTPHPALQLRMLAEITALLPQGW